MAHILIIGGSSGIGSAVAELAAEKNWRVTVASRNKEKARQFASRLSDAVTVYSVDISQPESVERLFRRCGEVDYLVVSAAELTYGAFATQSFDAMRTMIDTKLWGYIYTLRYAIPYLTTSASVVLLSGLAAWKPGSTAAIVAAVNGAIVSLGKALAVELAPVRVNVVAPGITDTPSWDHLGPGERAQFFNDVRQTLPVRRVAKASEIGQGILFALQNPFVTGTVLHMDGGALLV